MCAASSVRVCDSCLAVCEMKGSTEMTDDVLWVCCGVLWVCCGVVKCVLQGLCVEKCVVRCGEVCVAGFMC